MNPRQFAQLHVSDRALRVLAAHAAAATPGVARLHVPLTRMFRPHLSLRSRWDPDRARPAYADDPRAVDVDRPDGGNGTVTVTIRVIATGQPPVLDTVTAVQQRAAETLHRLANTDADVHVHVTAIDAGYRATRPFSR